MAIEVGADRRWSAARHRAPVRSAWAGPCPMAPPEQRLSDVLAEVVRLRNALMVLRDSPAEAPEN